MFVSLSPHLQPSPELPSTRAAEEATLPPSCDVVADVLDLLELMVGEGLLSPALWCAVCAHVRRISTQQRSEASPEAAANWCVLSLTLI